MHKYFSFLHTVSLSLHYHANVHPQLCLGHMATQKHIGAKLSPRRVPTWREETVWRLWQGKAVITIYCIMLCVLSELQKFLAAAAPAINSITNGVFIDSCLKHTQSHDAHSWSQIKVKGQTALETFSSWYFGNGGGASKVVDCDTYPCNPTCWVNLWTPPVWIKSSFVIAYVHNYIAAVFR